MSRPSTESSRAFGLLLRCYPAAVRERFADGMRDAFEREHAAACARGRFRVVAFWVTAFTDAALFHAGRLRSGGPFMKGLLTVDLRDGLRSLRTTPVVTAVAVVSLALGIGANTALFSILNSVLLKTLPVRHPEQLAMLDEYWTNPIWEQIRDRRHELFDDAFAWSGTRFNLAPRGATDFVDGAWASGGMFDVLGVHAVVGRTFTLADDVRGGGRDGAVAVISHSLWMSRFGAQPSAVGQTLSINGVRVQIIGVLPQEFFGPDVGRRADVIVPIGLVTLERGDPHVLEDRSMWWLQIMARLRPGETLEQATAALRAIQPQIREATVPGGWPASEQKKYLTEPLKMRAAATGDSELRDSYVASLEIVLAVVAAVLVIACANLANLLLARASSRRHELAVRLALGASRSRLARQLVLESLLLGAAGALGGLGVAQWASAAVVSQIQTFGAGAGAMVLDLSPDWRVLLFTVGVTAAATLIFGVAPAFGLTGITPQQALKEQSRTVSGDRRFGLRSVLVMVQVALSLALMIGATLLVRSLDALSHAPLGFDADRVLAVHVDSQARVPNPDARLAMFDHLREVVAATPGVSNAALSVLTPLGNSRWNTRVESTPATADLTPRQRTPWVNVVSPGWFATLGMHLVDGRDFDAHDVAGSEKVAIVTETFAHRFFPNQGAIGDVIRTSLEGPDITTYRIVGVVSDSAYTSARAGFAPILYVPLAQLTDVPADAMITARAVHGPPAALARSVDQALSRAENRVDFTIWPLSDDVRMSVQRERLVAMLGGFFGVLSLVLAAIGLYGVAAHSVNQRRAEIGIRMALGADATGVVRLVLGHLLTRLAAGVVAGLVVAWWAMRFVESLLFQLHPHDAVTTGFAAAVLVGAGLLAGWLPARRASRIDPVRVLREV